MQRNAACCNNSDFYPELCNRESRIACYFHCAEAGRLMAFNPSCLDVICENADLLYIERCLGLCGMIVQLELTAYLSRRWKI